jgi:hypothetical protein
LRFLAGNLRGPAKEIPTPPSDHTPLGGVVRSGPLQWRQPFLSNSTLKARRRPRGSGLMMPMRANIVGRPTWQQGSSACAAIRPIPDFCFSSRTGQTLQRPRAYTVWHRHFAQGLSIGATGGPRYSPGVKGCMIPSFVQQPSNVKCPHCPRCQGRMVLARIQASGICEKRSFDCPYCNFIETQIVDDPVRTAALVRLANSIRPPT